MKKIVVLLVLTGIAAAMSFAASESVERYTRLYNNLTTNSAQLNLLQDIEKEKPGDAGEFYAMALRRLLADRNNPKAVTERNAENEQAKILTRLIGAEKYIQAAGDVWLTVDAFADPLVKAEAIAALGTMQATDFFPHVVRQLEILNGEPTQDRQAGERIAFGAILALEKYASKDGYLPVYFAATGWYSKRIKDQAAKSLAVLDSDPTSYMMGIIKGAQYDYPSKYTALQTIEKSNVDNREKVSIAIAALAEGWRVSTSDQHLQSTIATMRSQAISMINRYKDDTTYDLLERCYTTGYDVYEKYAAVDALASQKTDESAELLSKFLSELNVKRQADNIVPEDEDMVKRIIGALGTTGRPVARTQLEVVKTLEWTDAVKELADRAIKRLR